jgi:hypothetical protein
MDILCELYTHALCVSLYVEVFCVFNYDILCVCVDVDGWWVCVQFPI